MLELGSVVPPFGSLSFLLLFPLASHFGLNRPGPLLLPLILVILAAYYIETHYFRASVFGAKTLLLFVVFQFVSINVVTVLAYWVDKRAAVRGAWRVPEINLHTLEFLGGWSGALLAQRLFRHKTKKRSYQSMFWFILLMQAAAVYVILRYLGLL